MELPSVSHLWAAVRLVSLALLIPLVPAAALADRPKIKPHHKVPKDWRKFVAAKNSGVPYRRPVFGTNLTVSYSYIDFSGGYSGSSTTTTASGASTHSGGAVLDFGISFDSVSFYNNAASYAVAGLVKSGAGTADLTGSFTGGASTTGAGGTLLLTPSNLGTTTSTVNLATTGNAGTNAFILNGASMQANNFVISQGTRISIGGATSKLPAALVAAINAGQITLADAAGTVAVEVDPITSEQTFVVNGVNIPWPDATHPLRLVAVSSIGSTSASQTVLAQTGLEDHTLTAAVPAELTALRTASGFTAVSPVPEPSTTLLFLVGAGLFSQRRRRG